MHEEFLFFYLSCEVWVPRYIQLFQIIFKRLCSAIFYKSASVCLYVDMFLDFLLWSIGLFISSCTKTSLLKYLIFKLVKKYLIILIIMAL